MEKGRPYRKLDRDQAALLLVDHQAGLFGLVRDFEPEAFHNNVLALADVGRMFKLPTVLTTSFDTGPNGPLLPELREAFPDAACVRRPGQINAWDDPNFVRAVAATGRRQLIIAGIVTEVCVAFPALSAVEAGYDVFVVTDASGTFNEASRYAAWSRMAAAGVELLTWFAAVSELQRDWRNDVTGLANLMAAHVPEYKRLIESYEARAPHKELEPA